MSTFSNAGWTTPGFVIDDAGFRSTFGASDTFRFAHPLQAKLDKQEKYETELTCRLFAPNPKSVWFGAWSPGFELYVPYGLELGLTSLVGPNLTVKDASYGPGKPTPTSKWVLLTFADAQPPLLFVFLGEPGQLTVEGAAGEWKLRTTGRYRGRIRVCLPFGIKPLTGNNVATLGRFASVVSRQEGLWCSPRPRLLSTESAQGDSHVTLSYTFDHAGALVPPVAVLAKIGGNPLRTLSPVTDPSRHTEAGPLAFSAGSKIELRFPLRRLPAGRGLTVDGLKSGTPPTPSDLTAFQGLSGLLAPVAPPRPDPAHEVGGDSLGALDLQAARLLGHTAQNRAYGPRPDSDTVPKLLRKWNPVDWRLTDADPSVADRASAMTALAAALEPDGRSELYGALLCAGLDAKTGYTVFCKGKDLPLTAPSTSAFDPYRPLLRALYSEDDKALEACPYVKGLSSPVRLLSAQPVTTTALPVGYRLAWPHSASDRAVLVLSVSAPCSVFPGDNVESVEATDTFGLMTVRYVPKAPGECSVVLKPPKWAQPLPDLTDTVLFPQP
ncbi:MAG: hypothetical protein JST30_02440 [Armatimonadetes bacterium]|nr:hypothetical protein [Armatimonadota bacterium]